MTAMGIDVAWARPTTDQIRATGATWVGRYFSTDDTKNLTAAEVAAYPAAGLAIVTVWETSTGRATQGTAAGVADALAAERERVSVGLPGAHVHHFAVDEEVAWDQVADYFAGAASVIGQGRVGVYGGYQVIEGAAAAGYRYLWQTPAWSGGRWSEHATIQQTGGTTLDGDADIDHALAVDFGQTPPPEALMAVDPADVATIANAAAAAVWDHSELDPATGQPVRFGAVQAYMDYEHNKIVRSLTAQLASLSAVVAALAKDGGLTQAQAQAAGQAGATAALAALGQDLIATAPAAAGAAVSGPAS